MKISQICLDIIKKWEGYRPDAYLDPVGIPTIGYGTIRYPNGKKVRLGDQISEVEAEAFLKFDVDDTVANLEAPLRGIALTQNQFDALVSLCYNIGVGGFLTSTVLRKLKEGDFKAAAAGFDLWNKGTVGGVKMPLPGLIKRRKEERDLFEQAGAGGKPIDVAESVQDRVTRLAGFREGADNVLVGYAGDEVVEILVLKSALKEDFVATLQQYKNAREFRLAEAGEKIPAGKRTEVVGNGQTIPVAAEKPTLERKLLLFGMQDDDPGVTGSDIREMQQRLTDLGFYDRELNGIFDRATDDAIRKFQAECFGTAEADGKVGPKTWGKLWGADSVAKPPPEPAGPVRDGVNYLLLTKTGQKETNGCFKLRLDYVKNGQKADSMLVRSGQPSRQFFRKGKDSVQGSFEPIPEGKWFVHDIQWAGGKDVYNGPVWNSGLGPAKLLLEFVPPKGTNRVAIMMHLDWNKSTYPGTAGCVGIDSITDFKRLVGWLRETDPRDLYVDWGLGSVKLP
ncbi:MAG: glycoside hydrolase family protein [Acidobacteria bacterium]|nr:glycoside hydrolase family protein [Acidobacteriota bacterium]